MAVCTDNISTVGLNSDLKHAEEDSLLCVAGWRLKSKYWKPSECTAMCSQPVHIHATLKTKHPLSPAEGVPVVRSCDEHTEAREITLC